jgi:hypothetical protein
LAHRKVYLNGLRSREVQHRARALRSLNWMRGRKVEGLVALAARTNRSERPTKAILSNSET